MNGILIKPAKAQSKRTARFDTKKSHLPLGVKKNALHQRSSVPLYINCLGGNWEGQIQLLKTGSLELRIQGLPPVKAGQELKFQCFGKSSTSVTHIQTGIIQYTKIQRGSTVWEGTTILLVEPHCSQRTISTCNDSQNDSFLVELGSFVISQVTEGEAVHSCEMEPQTDESLHFNASRNKPLRVPNNRIFHQAQHIKSSRMSIQNSSGHTIMAYHDYPIDTDLSTLPVVVLAPGYGETKRDYLTLAYYFATNGFHVIRYDHTNHVGESQGTHFDISLSSMKQDFQTVSQFVRQQWPQSPVIGVASSLASRVALKAEAEKPSLALLVLLVGIVDVQQSVATVHQEDVFANYLNGHIQDSANILGFNVGRHFLHDAITNKFSTLNTTLEDIQALETPVMYISAGKDTWIEETALATFKQSLISRASKWLDVPEALHRLQENPKIARRTYRHIVQHCHENLGLSLLDSDIHEPNRGDLGRQNRQEKLVLQQQSQTHVGQGFWSDYLGNFQTVGTCQDYVQLLDHVFHALGPITPGQRFLDAGCGNGNAGLFFLQSLQETTTRPRLISGDPIRYVGIDIVKAALGRAQFQMTQAYRSQQQSQPNQFPPVQMSWSQVDLQHLLPFADNHFDRIVSNLVLGYVVDPQAVLRELFRVLAPGGRMVISNLKPNGDFSGIYHNLVSHAGQRNQKTEARELLNNYGKIRQAEKEGQFRFFDHTEWRTTLDTLDCVHAGVYPTFANQAYLIVLEKQPVSTHLSLPPTQQPGVLLNSVGNTFQAAA